MAKTLSRSTVSRVAYGLFSTCSRVVTPVPLRAVINCRQSPPPGVNKLPIIPALFRLMKIQNDINTFSHPYYVCSLPEYLGLDYEHWIIVMKKKPGGENANKQQMIDCYVQTLAKIVGSEEEAKRKMYNVSDILHKVYVRKKNRRRMRKDTVEQLQNELRVDESDAVLSKEEA